MGPFLDRVVGSGKASLIRGHLSRDMNEVRGQALHLSWGKAFQIRRVSAKALS